MVSVHSIIFVSLLLDLFAFTIPLPLFPRIVQWFNQRESSDPNGFMSSTLRTVSTIRGLFYNPPNHSARWDIVLLGGLMGSVFSFLQFIVSPRIGALSDKYGRRRVLLVTMVGNILSALIWIKSTTFATYMLSRVVGGLSEGNVQLAIAILSDVSTHDSRSKSLALVGIAFAICFTIGPPIGAYFASRPLPTAFSSFGIELNVYAVPALLTLVLLLAETLFLYFALPETKGNRTHEHKRDGTSASASIKLSPKERLKTLKHLRRVHFFFLCIFSGVEFTLTFLTFDLLDWTNVQNGKLLGFIGIVSALLQGGYIRRAMSKTGESVMARQGVSSCIVGLVLLALLPVFATDKAESASTWWIIGGAALCLGFTSATVVNALTAHASLMCDEPVDKETGKPNLNPALAKGRALGKFRSSGQAGRALGPLLVVTCYWTFGPMITYSLSALTMLLLLATMKRGKEKRNGNTK